VKESGLTATKTATNKTGPSVNKKKKEKTEATK